MLIPNFIHIWWRTQCFRTFRIFLGLILETLGYYLDFVKDWIIFAVLYNFADKSRDFFSFEMQLVFMLGVFLVLPELIRGIYFAHHFKILFDVEEYVFYWPIKYLIQIFVVLLSPFIPAVLLGERGKTAIQNLRVCTVLYEFYCKHEHAIEWVNIRNFRFRMNFMHA